MIANDVEVEEQQSETSFTEAGTSSQNQVAIPVADDTIARVSWPSDSDLWSTSDDTDGKQISEIKPHVFTGNGAKTITTLSGNTGTTIDTTTVIQDGATINQHIYCCPTFLDYALKSSLSRRAVVIFIISLLGISFLIFVGLWLSSIWSKPKLSTYAQTEKTFASVNHTLTKLPKANILATTPITRISSLTTELSSTILEVFPDFYSTENYGLKIVNRDEWSDMPPNFMVEKFKQLPTYMIFSETGTDLCTTTQKCREIVSDIQALDLANFLQADIMYNFVIGGDGIVYEGLGWDVPVGSENYNTDYFDLISISVSFIGNFEDSVPSEIALRAAKNLLEFGLKNKKLSEDYKLKCLRQLSYASKNPGDKLYDLIKVWERWDNRTIEAFISVGSYAIV